MTTNEKLALLVAGVIGFSIWRKKTALQNVVFLPGPVVGIFMSGASPVIQVTLIAQNTSDQTLMLQSLAGNVFANSTLIGNISSFSTQYIPANSQTSILVSMRLYALGLVNDIISIFQNKNQIQEITVEGSANVGFFQVPVPLRLKFPIGI